MRKLINLLPIALPAAVLVGLAVYSLWFRHLPQADGRITGDYAAASTLATDQGVPLFVAVDLSPH